MEPGRLLPLFSPCAHTDALIPKRGRAVVVVGEARGGCVVVVVAFVVVHLLPMPILMDCFLPNVVRKYMELQLRRNKYWYFSPK